MREFTTHIMQEIRSELALIWAGHKAHGLEGKMRLYTSSARSGWKARQTDFEYWFGPNELDQALELIELHYNSGNAPNSPLLLDPMVHAIHFGEAPKPVGSGVLWCMVFLKEGETPDPNALDRLRGVNMFAGPIERSGQPGGFKMLAFLKEPQLPDGKNKHGEAVSVEGIEELRQLADGGVAELAPYYLLSGLTYHHEFGEYQHGAFNDIFGASGVPAHKFLKSYQIKLQRIKDAVTCWDAYEHNDILYRRFGVDVVNLERNLKLLGDADAALKEIRAELALIWAAHKRVGLSGQMRLFTHAAQDPWRSLHAGTEHWFDDSDASLDKAIAFIKLEYNGGNLPNTPLLLDPIVHDKSGKPLGSGVIWATALSLGIDDMKPEALERLRGIGAIAGEVIRGQKNAGVKALAFAEEALKPENGEVAGCKELYELAGVNAPMYRAAYMVSGLEYLAVHGSYQHPHFSTMFAAADKVMDAGRIGEYTVPVQRIKDAATCWHAYDHHHALYRRFGVDVANLEQNLRYYNLCARDFELLDATGPARATAEESFEMIVEGWIPRGAITLLAATGGTGKSSLAHYLAVLASIDWRADEPAPLWLGSPLNTKLANGICVYFSGEDGPAIVNARTAVFDPESRAKRLMFQRTEFGTNAKGEPATLDEFLARLSKMPDVPVMVIDPARKYLEGDEDNAEVVSNFFEAIEEFAIRKKTAVIVVHHLAKGAKPKDTSEVLDCLRGSQVFIDRPRVVIGMLREGPYTIAGLAKNNIPPSLGMVQGERVFVRDPDSLQLLWVPGEKGIRRDTLTEEQLEQLKQEVGV